MSIVKVIDAKTGKLKRYEDEHGKALAVMVSGRLQVTAAGAERELVVSKGKLHEIGREFPAA